MNFDDLQAKRRYKQFIAYANSKLCNIWFTYALARRLRDDDVTANCLHPGVVASSFARDAPLMNAFYKVSAPLMLTAEQGAQTSIFLASDAAVSDVTGEYFAKCRSKKSRRDSYHRETQERLWHASEELVTVSKS